MSNVQVFATLKGRPLNVSAAAERSTPPTPQEMTTMGKLIEEGMKAGWLIVTEGCLSTSRGAPGGPAAGEQNVEHWALV
jgi:hypothetical protein